MRRLLMFVVVLLSCVRAEAHPHRWVDGTLDFAFDQAGLARLELHWVFDDFNSADLMSYFDLNKDGKLSGGEVDFARERGFDHLYDNGYFILAKSGDAALDIPAADSFTARVEDGKVVYEFGVPVRVPWTRLNGLTIGLFDQSYFIDFGTVSRSPPYASGGRSIAVTATTLSLATDGWGTVKVPALRLQVQ